MSTEQSKDIITCDFSAIAPQDRPNHATLADSIFGRVLSIKETQDGYAFQLPLDDDTLQQVAQFISNERLCCPFFTFKLIVNDELWLQLSGDEDVKTYIKQIIVVPIIETGTLQWEAMPQAFVSPESYEAASAARKK
jgi:hypothetical protein